MDTLTKRDKFDAMRVMGASRAANDDFVRVWTETGDTDAAYRAALAHLR